MSTPKDNLVPLSKFGIEQPESLTGSVVELMALNFVTEMYMPCSMLEVDEYINTADLLSRLYMSFGNACTSLKTLHEYMVENGFRLNFYDSQNPKWMLKHK